MVKIAYIDSSVIVKHYAETEKGSFYASQLIKKHDIYLSAIAKIEILSALSQKFRSGEISNQDRQYIKNTFLSDCHTMYFIQVSDDVIAQAQHLVLTHTIKSLDAIHLASAIVLQKITETSFPFITADKRLAAIAEKESFPTIQVGV